MRGIERPLAAIALMAALGGIAAFAHNLVGDTTDAQPVPLAAAPRQHVSAPTPVWVPVPAPVRALARPSLTAASAPVAAPAPLRRIVVPRLTPRPAPARKPVRPVPAPVAAVPPSPPAPPAPAPVVPAPEQPPRVLASIAPTPAHGDDVGKDEDGDQGQDGGHGHEGDHGDQGHGDRGDEGDQGDHGDRGHD